MTPIFPLFPHDVFGRYEGHVIGVAIGIAFGFVLERAGFGRASNLAAQFYGGDNRVLKVMFTAIATTAASLGLLSALGLLDLGQLTVPETYLLPQIVGGLLLGAGFVVAGYCPGTGVVAAASGSVDGWVTYLGVMLGTLVFGAAWPLVAGFYGLGGRGSLRLDELLGLPFPVVALAVVAVAVAAFAGAERLEAWLSARRGEPAPVGSPRLRNAVLAGVAVIAAFALVPDASAPAAAAGPFPTIGASELAERVVTAPRTLWVVDLRDRAACAVRTVPGATCRPEGVSDARFLADLPPTRTLVLVTEPGAQPDVSWPGEVRVLEGGWPAFVAEVLTPPAPPSDATSDAIAAYQRRVAVHAYLTGAPPPPAAAVSVKKAAAGPVAKKGGGC